VQAGGKGALGFIPLTSYLVVFQSLDVQEQIDEILRALRRCAQSEIPATGTDATSPVKGPSELQPLPDSHSGVEPQNPTPALPAIDPSLIDALQKALLAVGDLGVPRLILHVEEQPDNDDQENAVPPEWPSEPSDVEFPSLFVDPVDDPLTIVEDEEPAEDLPPPAIDLSKLIQEVVDAIRAGNSVLVQKAGAGLNLEFEWQLGGARVAVLSGHDGQRYVLVSLSAEASGDLRAAQRAHDERILHWIESLNEPVFDYDAAEEEDADYGDEPANEAIP
jgi:hypothetical protein